MCIIHPCIEEYYICIKYFYPILWVTDLPEQIAIYFIIFEFILGICNVDEQTFKEYLYYLYNFVCVCVLNMYIVYV